MKFLKPLIYTTLFLLSAVFFTAQAQAANVYYSVGQNTTDHSSGGNVSITGGVATFINPQVASNLGVGDKLIAGGNTYYLASKTSTTVWNVVTNLGAVPGDLSSTAVTSISHTFDSLNNAIIGASGAAYLNTTDLVAGDYQLNIPCYYDSGADTTAVTITGYTTDATRFIKIYAPSNSFTEANLSQRHSGKWDGARYNMVINNTDGIRQQLGNVWIDGLQIQLTNVTSNYMGIRMNGTVGANANVRISGNILRGTTSTASWHMGIDVWGSSGSGVVKIWDNVIYDFKVNTGNSAVGIGLEDNYTYYVYNNTIYNCGVGINLWGGTAILKNNLVQSTGGTNYNGTWDASSTNNVSQDATSPDVALRSKTALFVDTTNKDFHLLPTDIVAKNAGADLSADANLPFATDIDGNTRTASLNAWDIGADESVNNVYYSVGQSVADLKTGAPTVTITGGAAVFSVAQTGNIGVGDRVTYNTNQIVYISAKTNANQLNWNLVTATGAIPADIAASTVVSITREFTSLSAAVTAASNATHINSSDLVAANTILNLPTYYDSGADTTQVSLNAWQTGQNNLIKIYTPTSTTTEANFSQRHNGKWDDSKYSMVISASADYTRAILFDKGYIWVDGLQIKVSNNDYNYATGLHLNYTAANIGQKVYVSNNIITENHVTTNNDGFNAINMYYATGYIWNNLIYNSNLGGNASNSAIMGYYNHHYVYNNTLYNVSGYGIRSDLGSVLAKNNLVQQASFNGAFDAASSNNLSQDASSPNAALQSKTVSFADIANKDFHLSSSDIAAKNAGADLSADANLPLTTDIDGQTRPTGVGVVDIGADEAATAIFYSVGQNTNDHSIGNGGATCSTTGACTVTIASGTATFNYAQTANNLGVGDKVTYNGTSVAYISAKISQTQWKLVTNIGAIPSDVTGQTVNSIAHAFASLSAARAGASDPSNLNTTNLVAGNYQLNFPCYYDSGADTTNVSIDNYTTSTPNYIRIYTPFNIATEVNLSQRHSGTWDNTKYSLQTTGRAIDAMEEFVRIDGLQMKRTANDTSWESVVWMRGVEQQLTNSIITANFTGTSGNDRGILSNTKNLVVANNIIYNIINGSNVMVAILENLSTDKMLAYNNTISNSYYGISGNSGTIAKNNITQNCTDGFNGTFNAASNYNISDLATDAPGANSKNSTTVLFANAANSDFHLLQTDTAAKNAGVDLSADGNFAFSVDIDGSDRSAAKNAWDIGADEAATAIYYSVGQNTTSHETGAGTITVDATARTATFSVAQTATNMGVGDLITYVGGSCYITNKVSTSVWGCQNATGGAPTAAAAGTDVTSVAHAFSSLTQAIGNGNNAIANASHLNTPDLVAGNYQLNLSCYYDSGANNTGLTMATALVVSSSNFVKMYTPVNTATESNTNQRHSGRWDDGRFSVDTVGSFYLNTSHTVVDGLQFNLGASGVNISGGAIGVRFSNSIVKSSYSATYGIRIDGASSTSADSVYIYNNIVYGMEAGIIRYYDGGGKKAYVYNNTVSGSTVAGIRDLAGSTIVAKNNIVQSSADGYLGTFNAASNYNISNLAADAPGANSKNSTTVSFADSANFDFHLASTDTAAKNQGTSLESDSALAFNTDIDGQTRSGSWDIGADEAANNVFYSVGQSVADLKTGAPTVTITGGAAVFSVAQTGNIGVGDRVTYNTNQIAYISAKTNANQLNWNLVTATGAIPADIAASTVVSITREFTSLSAAVTAASNGTHINNTNLFAANVALNLPCYYDSGADTTIVNVAGYTTSSSNFIKIYTTNNAATESNVVQRHQGKWDNTKYRLDVNNQAIFIGAGNVRLDGMQLRSTWVAGDVYTLQVSTPETLNIQLSNNIIRGNGNTGSTNWYEGITFYSTAAVGSKASVWNNIIYGYRTSAGSKGLGIATNLSTLTLSAYNNTVTDCDVAYFRLMGVFIAKNNIAQNSTDGYFGTFDASSNYNISNLAADAPGANSKNSTTVSFLDAANFDFHLLPTDTAAKNAGVDLSADANLPITIDIDGQSRPTGSNAVDIGADEAANAIFYSVGQSAADLKTGSPTITTLSSGAATLTVAQTGNIGVGDRVTYNGSQIAYISAKTNADGLHWSLVTAQGALPADAAGVVVNSITREFTSLSAAVTAASNATHINSLDLVSTNAVLNIPCYYDTGADTTTVNVTGYTTSASNFIKIYTPNNTTTEANNSQRHGGAQLGNYYKLLKTSDWGYIMDASNSNLIIEGLTGEASQPNTIGFIINQAGAFLDNIRFRDNLLINTNAAATTYARGINIFFNASTSTVQNFYISNNIITGFGNGIKLTGPYNSYGSLFVYNNTVTKSTIFGITVNDVNPTYGNFVYKNNLVYDNVQDWYGSAYDAGTTNNISKDATAPGTNAKISQTVSFVDAANFNFHLASNDTAAKKAGTNLQNDSFLRFSQDIDGQERAGNWDIGADEFSETQISAATGIQTIAAPEASKGNTNGLVGYWSFDGPTISAATVSDLSGSGNSGTISGGVATALGKIGQALSFDGNNVTKVHVNNSASLANLSNFSASTWVKFNSFTNTDADAFNFMFNKGWEVSVNNSGKINFRIATNAAYPSVDSNQNLAVGKWYYVTAVFSGMGTIPELYLDGLNVGSAGFIGGGIRDDDSIFGLRIGCLGMNDYSYNSNAFFDEVRIYNRALSAGEIGELYKVGQVEIRK